MNDEVMLKFIKNATDLEIIPGTTNYLSEETLSAFAGDIYERFSNPQVIHALMDISLNSTAKWKSRLLPTALDYVNINGVFPKYMAFSLASMLVFFKGKRGEEVISTKDEQQFMDFYTNVWSRFESGEVDARGVVTEFLGLVSHWETDLNEINGLTDQVTSAVESILENGMESALTNILSE
jgi:tagaturonate reductase